MGNGVWFLLRIQSSLLTNFFKISVSLRKLQTLNLQLPQDLNAVLNIPC